jgi:hypothetical protein
MFKTVHGRPKGSVRALLVRSFTRVLPDTAPPEDTTPTCRRCYQPLDTQRELDLNRNPRELCVDCLNAEEAIYDWETA